MVLYHVTSCAKLDRILKEGIKRQNFDKIWFTDKEGVDVIARHWVNKNVCVIVVDMPKSYVRVGRIAYYGSRMVDQTTISDVAMEYYSFIDKFKLEWIKEVIHLGDT
jgi:RNA:NAD 2'-phosphotransferase (TPT1/KptA family)